MGNTSPANNFAASSASGFPLGYVYCRYTATLLPVQKEFYMVMISERKAKIIDYSMEQLM
jgi:hypothetical protein